MLRLARATGRAPHILGREWRAAELAELEALERIEPSEDGYWQAALVASTVYNMLRGERAAPMTIGDFLPGPAPPPPDATETAARIDALTRPRHREE